MPDVSTDTAYPLTPFQEAIFLGQQFGDRPSSYHIPIGMRIEGEIDPARLRAALQQVVRRHTILSATIGLESGRLVQRLNPDRPVDWHTHDCSQDADGDASAESFVAAFAARPFNLTSEPPIRAALLKVRQDRHTIVLIVHHVVFDGWSRQLLVRELVQQYARMAAAPDAKPLLTPRRQYVHYALEQSKEDTDPVERAQRDYLRELSRTPDVLLPTDMPRLAASDALSGHMPISFVGEIVRRLRDLTRGERITSFVFFLAIFNLWLQLRAGRGGARIAFPVNCRERPEDLELIGCFVNTLLLRVDVDLERTVTEYLQSVRDTVMQVLRFKNHPLRATRNGSVREAGYEALSAYRVMCAYQERQPDQYAGEGLRIEPFVLHAESAKCELTLFLDNDGRSVTGAIEYRRDLFHKSTIEQMRRGYITLVHHALDRPSARLRDLFAQAGGDFAPAPASTPAASPRDRSAAAAWTPLPEQISAWARRVPDRIALESAQGSLSYAELDRLSDHWCEALRARGVGIEDRIGVAIDPGMAAIPAMLAIMKAGAAYVPLDLDGPPARLEPQIRASAMKWILCTDRRRDADLFGARVLRFDETPPGQLTLSRANVVPSAETLAYIIYTSGSSGAPKGVMITHGGLNNYLSWCTGHYRMHEAPTLTQTSLLSDMTITTIWGPLFAGQRVCVADAAPGIEGLRAALALEQEFAVVKMTPSHLRILRHEPGRFAARAWCGTCVLGGEALNRADLEPWMHLGMRLVNEYGPTETVVGSLVHDVETLPAARAVPIGAPLRGTTAQLLDEQMRAVPSGTPGEIFIGGAGVGRGYERQPASTAASFVPDERADRAGARMYRTGDLGVRLAAGNVEYLGRRDEQMKIHGYRVEPAEVEGAIASHADVTQVVVALRHDNEGASLVAYIERAPEANCTVRDLQDFLRPVLPSHMIPRLFRFVARVPLLPNGKADRRGVLELEQGKERKQEHQKEQRLSARRGQDPVPSHHRGLERRVLAVWREVLGNEAIEPTDHFFDVGGDSVRLYAVYRRLVDVVGQEFPAMALFEYPTVRSCAEYLRTFGSDVRDEPPMPLEDPEQADLERQRLLALNEILRHSEAALES